jgi:hypothetical protein
MEVPAVCHVHSEWSYDAKWPLATLGSKFSERGCRVLMMTEHDRGFTAARWKQYRAACIQASSDSLLVLPGMEYSDDANRVHVLVWGPVPFLGEGLPTGEMLNAVKDANGVAVLAHPSRKTVWEIFAPEWSDALLGIELWNRKYDGWAPSETSPGLLRKANALPFVGLDFHSEKQMFPLTMVLDVEPPVSENTVLDCLRARRCSPHAFGLPLKQNLLGTVLPVLHMAERGRRTAARIVKRTGVVSR